MDLGQDNDALRSTLKSPYPTIERNRTESPYTPLYSPCYSLCTTRVIPSVAEESRRPITSPCQPPTPHPNMLQSNSIPAHPTAPAPPAAPGGPLTQPQIPFPPEYFGREDEQDDALFYAQPRLVVHIDDGAIAAVAAAFRRLIPPHAAILDLMSSWRSHWPADHPKTRLTGLGLNAVELAENLDLDDYLIHDLNRHPQLPFPDAAFDAVVITVSVQYLTRPIAVFQEVHRILQPAGVFIVTFSNRMFPTKAVRIWRATSDRGHLDLVAAYMDAADFTDIQGGLTNPDTSPPDDPLFLVTGAKPAAAPQ